MPFNYHNDLTNEQRSKLRIMENSFMELLEKTKDAFLRGDAVELKHCAEEIKHRAFTIYMASDD